MQRGTSHKPESKRKISETMKGMKWNEERKLRWMKRRWPEHFQKALSKELID